MATAHFKLSKPAPSVRPTNAAGPSPAEVQAARLLVEANRKLGKTSSANLLRIASGRWPAKRPVSNFDEAALEPAPEGGLLHVDDDVLRVDADVVLSWQHRS